MKKLFLMLVAAAFATSPAAAADDWKIYRYAEHGFAAEYPIPPTPVDEKPEPTRTISRKQFWSERDDVAFGVSVALFVHKVIAGQPPEKQIQNVIEGVRGSFKCEIRSQRAIAFPGATGREVIFDKCPAPLVEAIERVFIAGDRLFQVMVLGNKRGIVGGPDTKRFMQSFSLMAQ